FHRMVLPEYLSFDDPESWILGHSGIEDLVYDNGRSTFDNVRRLVDQVAPGLLASRVELWDRGQRIGRGQGAVDALHAILARGRDQTIWNDMISRYGHDLFLVNPVGPFLTSVVRIGLKARRIS